MATKPLDLEAEALEIFTIGIKGLALSGSEMKREWQQQTLSRRCSPLEGVHELLKENALVSRMLIDENQTVFVLERDVRAPQLK